MISRINKKATEKAHELEKMGNKRQLMEIRKIIDKSIDEIEEETKRKGRNIK